MESNLEGRASKWKRSQSTSDLRVYEFRMTLGGTTTRWALAFALACGGVVTMLWARCGVAGCPDPGELVSYTPGGAPLLLDRSGGVITSLHPLERVVVDLDSVPEYLPQALLSVEDRRFYRHGGVDWLRVMGACPCCIRGK